MFGVDSSKKIIKRLFPKTYILYKKRLSENYKKNIMIIPAYQFYKLQCNGYETVRPDIAVRYMCARDIINGISEDESYAIRLYKKMVRLRNNGDDVAHLNRFRELIDSWNEGGVRQKFISSGRL